MKTKFLLLIVSLFFTSLIFGKDKIYIEPTLKKIDNSIKFHNQYHHIDGDRTFEDISTNKNGNMVFEVNKELISLYNDLKRPTFVILYNRLLDDHLNQPMTKISLLNKAGEYDVSQKIYLPMNKPRYTLKQKEKWEVEQFITKYFNTNRVRSVDRNFLLRLGEVNANEFDSVREIEIKSLSKGADYIFEILFSHTKDFKLKVTSIETAEVVFNYYSSHDKKSTFDSLSSNNDFANVSNKQKLEKRLESALNKFSEQLVQHFKNKKLNIKESSNRISNQEKYLGVNTQKGSHQAYNDKFKKSGTKATGTGFYISKNGYIVTNSHVVNDSKEIFININDIRIKAKLIDEDKYNDIALLKVNKQSKSFLPLGINEIEKGLDVCALGYPMTNLQGKELKTTFGHINSLSGLKGDVRFLQVDTPIQPGNSGGPLVNMKGNVVGIITAKLSQIATLKATGGFNQNVNYALNINYLLPILNKNSIKTKSNYKSKLSNEELVKRVEESVVLIEAIY